MDSVPEKELVLSVTSPGFTGSGNANTGFVRVTLVPPDERERSQKQIVQMVNRNLPKFTEGRANVVEEQTISVNRRGGQPVAFVIQNNNFNKLTAILPKILEAARESKVLLNADVDLKFNKPELRVEIDRLKAAQLGVSVEDISQTLQLAYSNRRLGYFTKDGKQYQVMGQVARGDRDDPSDLKTLFVRNNRSEMISLDNLVTTHESNTPPTIYHFNRYKSLMASPKWKGSQMKCSMIHLLRRCRDLRAILKKAAAIHFLRFYWPWA
jgi:multidrug efflux pump